MEEASLYFALVLAMLFLSTGWSKVRKMEEHVLIVKDYQILPAAWAGIFARAEVWVELLLGALFAVGLYRTSAALVGAGLLVIYTLAIAINLFRGRKEVSCGCGGAAGTHQLSWWLVARNLLLICLCGYVATIATAYGSLDSMLAGGAVGSSFGFGFWMMAVMAGLSLLALSLGSELAVMRKQMGRLVKPIGRSL
ncbi:MauE/DoxX family redox-associated membrane protein [Tumebacillus lipolyticus]|uniref:MauE/DoxX family redox-associated membrane protein n=1 Tax=Tumebacillus lipolyticus TaxID=1280370 RepID=A0ABW4ZYA8_9BACL